MADTGESCSSSNLDSASDVRRPVVVRVKRKASQSPVEAFWLEINERPYKRPLLDFGKLSLSDSREKEELKNKKVFVQHVETVNSSDATIDILQSCLPTSADSTEFRTKAEERKHFLKEGPKQEQLLSKSKQKQELLSKNARFKQIWKSRKGKKDTKDNEISEMCHLYDVVRVDGEDGYCNKDEVKDTSVEDNKILCNFLPLLKEFLPSVAEEIQSDMDSYFSKQGAVDDYVYDLYTVPDELNASYEDSVNKYPLVQVNEEDDFYDGPIQSEFESDDSNAEDNPMNEYPDEETSEDEDDHDSSETSCDESEDAESSSDNVSVQRHDKQYDLEDEDLLYDEVSNGGVSDDEDGEDDRR